MNKNIMILAIITAVSSCLVASDYMEQHRAGGGAAAGSVNKQILKPIDTIQENEQDQRALEIHNQLHTAIDNIHKNVFLDDPELKKTKKLADQTIINDPGLYTKLFNKYNRALELRKRAKAADGEDTITLYHSPTDISNVISVLAQKGVSLPQSVFYDEHGNFDSRAANLFYDVSQKAENQNMQGAVIEAKEKSEQQFQQAFIKGSSDIELVGLLKSGAQMSDNMLKDVNQKPQGTTTQKLMELAFRAERYDLIEKLLARGAFIPVKLLNFMKNNFNTEVNNINKITALAIKTENNSALMQLLKFFKFNPEFVLGIQIQIIHKVHKKLETAIAQGLSNSEIAKLQEDLRRAQASYINLEKFFKKNNN